MDYVIRDEKTYSKLTAKIDNLQEELRSIEYQLDVLKADRNKLLEEVYDDKTLLSHSTELIDIFIKDNNFNGKWPEKLYYERWFYYQENTDSWDCHNTNLFVVYYREVELRYKQLNKEKQHDRITNQT